jgi:DNA-binding transcriptional regulator/RsmH inhibitor MraZ
MQFTPEEIRKKLEPYQDIRLTSFDAATIDEKKRVSVPSRIRDIMQDKWESDTFYGCNSFRGRYNTIRLYCYNPFYFPHDRSLPPGYRLFPVRRTKSIAGRITLRDEDLAYIGADRGGLVVWQGCMEYVNVWNFEAWKEHWERQIEANNGSPEHMAREHDYFIESILKEKSKPGAA